MFALGCRPVLLLYLDPWIDRALRADLASRRPGRTLLARGGRCARHSDSRRAGSANLVGNELEANGPTERHVVVLGTFKIAAVKEDVLPIGRSDDAAKPPVRQVRDSAFHRTPGLRCPVCCPRGHHTRDHSTGTTLALLARTTLPAATSICAVTMTLCVPSILGVQPRIS